MAVVWKEKISETPAPAPAAVFLMVLLGMV